HLDGFRFNRAVARIREFSNALEDFAGAEPWDVALRREAYETLAMLLGPMMPHFAEELWHRLGHSTLLVDQPWPQADRALTIEEPVTLAVQVNGKLRATMDLPRDAAREAVESAALAHPAVQRSLGGVAARKVIIVPNRLVNVVG